MNLKEDVAFVVEMDNGGGPIYYATKINGGNTYSLYCSGGGLRTFNEIEGRESARRRLLDRIYQDFPILEPKTGAVPQEGALQVA